MDFESRFSDMFRKESEFPSPHPLSIKRRKSFPDQFFKSGVGSSLKLPGKGTLKLSGKAALKFRQRFLSSPNKDRQFQQKEKLKTDEISFQFSELSESSGRSSFYVLSSDSCSVECLPMSENVDSYLPASSRSSVITLPKHKTLKISSRSKFGTFRRSDGTSSPYCSILKSRNNKNRPQLKAIDFDNPEPSFCYSQVSCNLPLTRFLDSPPISASTSFSTVVDRESKINFYGQNNSNTPLSRTDYSCRVFQKSGKDYHDSIATSNRFLNPKFQSKVFKQTEGPQQLEHSKTTENILLICSEDAFKEELEKDHSNSNSATDFKVVNAFHEELLLKCSKYRSDHHSPRKEKDSALSIESDDRCKLSDINANKQMKVEFCPKVSSKQDSSTKPKLFANFPVAFQSEITSSVAQTKTELTKPQLLPKPCVPRKPEVSLERTLVKPHIPVKPERLKNEKCVSPTTAQILSFKPPTEINNNCIVLKPSKTPRTNSLPSIVDACNENKRLLLRSDVEQDNIHKRLEQTCQCKSSMSEITKGFQSSLSASRVINLEPFQASRVKDLVASFNLFNSVNTESNHVILPSKT